MNQINHKMARLEAEAEQMVKLGRISDQKLREYIANLLLQAERLCKITPDMDFMELAQCMSDYRGDIGLAMRECEIRALR